ncbi:MAG TPA: L,D-transpeptidase family protein [Aggregatilinea sp.]|uniref:L,D-transpeptidase family protein n=1 Tax=Aggregatilinea sp. TaxID=2806333 RepID=UPI002CD5102D|nr:L,D-transpeptidase family protein [Aggregatilinea sp.]HML22300.1 L,D-transpeptidase family protein [Aggregatilinea sp.]
MTVHANVRPREVFKVLAVAALVTASLTACGGGDDAPPPTVADIAMLAASAPPVTFVPTYDPAVTFEATAIPSVEAPTLAPTLTPLPTDPPPTATSLPTDPPTIAPTDVPTLAPVETEPVEVAMASTEAVEIATVEATDAVPEVIAEIATEEVGAGAPVTFVYYTNRDGTDDVILHAADGGEYPLAVTGASEREPTCSPDGSTIVYASDATGNYQLYALRAGSDTPMQLTASEGINFAPSFSPDGSTIAFVSTRNEGIPTIWLVNADGTNPRQLTSGLGRDTSPAWGPDGQQLLFATDQEGTWDVFLTIVSGEAEGEFPVLPADFSDGNEIWPVFDPLGVRIAYSTWSDLNDPATSDLYLLDFELPEPQPLRVGDGVDIAWSWVDSTHLLATGSVNGGTPIVMLDITTGDIEPLTGIEGFNAGARPCAVDPAVLTGDATLPPASTPEPVGTDEITTEDGAVGRNIEGSNRDKVPALDDAYVLAPDLLTTGGARHVVQPGENLIKIGGRYGTTWTELAALNALADPDRLRVGQSLIVPVQRVVYPIGGPQPYDEDLQEPMTAGKEIVVKLSEQHVYAYEDGKLVRDVIVSTGLPDTPTVTGEYAIYQKVASQTMRGPGYYLPGVPYVMYFYESYGLHGTYWHDDFGQPMSHGCVNLPTPEAEWFYNWAEIGTPVIVLS